VRCIQGKAKLRVVMAQLSDWWVALNLRCEERAPEDNNNVENKYIHREIHSFETVKTLAIKIRNTSRAPFSFPVLATRSLSTSSTPFHLSTPPPPYLLVVGDVDEGRLELLGRDLAGEEDVKLSVRAVFHLGQEEVSHDEADDGGPAPDVAALAGEVPTGRVQQFGRD